VTGRRDLLGGAGAGLGLGGLAALVGGGAVGGGAVGAGPAAAAQGSLMLGASAGTGAFGSLSGLGIPSVRDFGAVGDDATDDLPAFREAIAHAVGATRGNWRKDHLANTPIFVPPGQYYLSGGLDIGQVCLIGLGDARLRTDMRQGVFLDHSVEAHKQSYYDAPPVLWNLSVGGPGRGPDNRLVGLRIGRAGGVFKNVTLAGFRHAVEASRYAYTVHLDHCKLSGNHIGLMWPRLFGAAGENVTVFRSTLSSNEIGMVLDHTRDEDGDGRGDGIGGGPGVHLIACSFDYNTERLVEIVRPGQYPDDIFFTPVFLACHFETDHETTGRDTVRILTGGGARFLGCTFWDDRGATILHAEREAVLIGNHFSVAGDGPYCTGDVQAYGNTQRYGGQVAVTAATADLRAGPAVGYSRARDVDTLTADLNALIAALHQSGAIRRP